MVSCSRAAGAPPTAGQASTTSSTRGGGSTSQPSRTPGALPAWRETPFLTDRERAALAFTETVTRLPETHVPAAAYHEVAAVFSPTEVAALLGLIVVINSWNALSITTRAWEPGSHQP
jgi:alkylhydroperoxidase family enzyme